MFNKLSRLSTLTAALSFVLLVGVAEVSAQNGVKSSPLPPKGTAEATREWTREEMLNAIPLDMVIRNGATVPVTVGEVPTPTGPAGSTPPGLGGLGRSTSMEAGAGKGEVATATSDMEAIETPYAAYAAFSYPYPYSRMAALPSEYTTYPYKTIGKVFFRQNGLSYVCSASSIGNYAVITAGHCVHRGNNSGAGWSTNFVFVPGYNNGLSPYGQFSANHLWTTTHWFANGQFNNFARDIGGAVLNKVTLGTIRYKISERVGWLGTMWNASYYQHVHSIGYPQAAPFNGLTMQICAASFGRHDTSFVPNTTGIGCDATGGTSGGPWVVGLRRTNYVNGVNSYKYSAQPQALYSPYFDTTAGNLIFCLIYSGPGVQRCVPPAAP